MRSTKKSLEEQRSAQRLKCVVCVNNWLKSIHFANKKLENAFYMKEKKLWRKSVPNFKQSFTNSTNA